jgi:hypothetical protein
MDGSRAVGIAIEFSRDTVSAKVLKEEKQIPLMANRQGGTFLFRFS